MTQGGIFGTLNLFIFSGGSDEQHIYCKLKRSA